MKKKKKEIIPVSEEVHLYEKEFRIEEERELEPR